MIGPVLRMINAVYHQVTVTWISVDKLWGEGGGGGRVVKGPVDVTEGVYA